MKKTSGLADSPFFKSTNPVNRATAEVFSASSQPEPIPRPAQNHEENPALARNMAIGQAILPESLIAGMPDSRQVGTPESLIARLPDILNASTIAESVRMALDTKAAKKESFRFPVELTEALKDIPHEVWKAHKQPISKTAIFVAALTCYLWDFRHHGKDSSFYKQLIEKTP